MQTSRVLAQLIGPTLLVIGLGMLANREGYRAMAREFPRSPGPSASASCAGCTST